MNIKTFPLTAGTLTLNISKELYPFESLIDVSERINPKRPFIFVSKVIGRYIPTSLKTLIKTANTLTEEVIKTSLLDNKDNISVISLSETALGLGALVHKRLQDQGIDNLNIFTTRHQSNLPLQGEFKETHSHLPNHYIYSSDFNGASISTTDTLVLVDDEITTGNTLYNLYKSLHLPNVKRIVIATIADWSGKDFEWDVPVTKVSLLSGTYAWESKEHKAPVSLPYNAEDYSKSMVLNFKQNFRQPTYNFFTPLDGKNIILDKDVVVVYYNELLPYCLKQYYKFADSEFDIFFLALSSSPIEVDKTVIKSKVEYSGFYSNVPVYLYNFQEFLDSLPLNSYKIDIVSEPFHIPLKNTISLGKHTDAILL